MTRLCAVCVDSESPVTGELSGCAEIDDGLVPLRPAPLARDRFTDLD
jgi:hypothetical protein